MLSLTLPKMAVKQIAEMLGLIVDRISSLPSQWLEALTPMLTWLTLHKHDVLVSTILEQKPTLRNDLARVHKILSNFCH